MNWIRTLPFASADENLHKAIEEQQRLARRQQEMIPTLVRSLSVLVD